MSAAQSKLSLLTATSMVIASMVGTGVFTSLGFQVADIKTGFSILLVWFVGGLVAFCGAVTYAELGNAFPRSGGEYNLLSRLYHPSLGFVAGWVSATVGFAAPAAIAALAFASYIKPIFPSINENHTAAACILIFGLLHGNSIKVGATFQNIITVTKILLILIFISLGLGIGEPQPVTVIPQTESWNEIFSTPYAIALVFVMYSYTGWNSSIYIIGEIKRPLINLPRSLFIGTGIVTILYVLLNFIFLYTVPISELEGQIQIGYLSGSAILGETGGFIISSLIGMLLLATVSAYIFVGPRITQVMGEDFPTLKWLSIKSQTGIPQNAFIFSTILSLLFIYTSTFDEVLLYTSFLLILITTLAIAGIFVLRIKLNEVRTTYKTWGYPVTPLIFLVISIGTLIFMAMDKPYESTVGIAILLIGLLLYFITNRRKSGN